jgi:hypothetical protein
LVFERTNKTTTATATPSEAGNNRTEMMKRDDEEGINNQNRTERQEMKK